MTPPVLCILQMRYHSTRLPAKMLQTLGNETLAARGWRIACEAFGAENCVVAIPASDGAGPLGDELRRIGATVYAHEGDENDVVARLYFCYLNYLERTDFKGQATLLVRITADDPFKTPDALTRAVDGEVMPVELGGEPFTFSDLLMAQMNGKGEREHITYAIADARRALGHWPIKHPPCPPGDWWTIDTAADLDNARRHLAMLEAAVVARDTINAQSVPTRGRMLGESIESARAKLAEMEG